MKCKVQLLLQTAISSWFFLYPLQTSVAYSLDLTFTSKNLSFYRKNSNRLPVGRSSVVRRSTERSSVSHQLNSTLNCKRMGQWRTYLVCTRFVKYGVFIDA